MEQLSPQHERPSLSGGQPDSERTQMNARVRKQRKWRVRFKLAILALKHENETRKKKKRAAENCRRSC